MEDNGKRKRTDKKLIRMQVIKAAAEAFSQKGIKNVRMDDIASSLSISKRTLYELFADKECGNESRQCVGGNHRILRNDHW